MAIEMRLWDAAGFLRSPASIAAYLEASLEQDDPVFLRIAASDVIRAAKAMCGASMLTYPINLTRDDNGTVMATIAGFPGATYGDDEAEALANAADLLATLLMASMSDRLDILAPEVANGRPTVTLSLLGTLKVAVYQAMRERGWRKADLARAMELNPRQIDRLLDLDHASTVAQLDAALAACGRRAVIKLEAVV